MPFALSGSTITQSGTDADLSGLSGITGVTVEGTQYTLDGVRLEVAGSLTMNGYVERLRFINSPTAAVNGTNAQLAVLGTGTFEIVTAQTFDGATVNRMLPVIDFGSHSVGFGVVAFGGTSRRHIAADVGSTVTLRGVLTAETSGSGLAYAFDGTTTLQNVALLNQNTSAAGNQQVAFAQGGSVTISDCSILRYAYTDRGGSYISIDGLAALEDSEGFVWNFTTAASPQKLTIEGYDPQQMTSQDFRTNMSASASNGSVVEFSNPAPGNGLVWFTNQDASRGMRAIITNTLTLTFVDESLSAIPATVFGVDEDNGARGADFTPPGESLIAASGDIEYLGTGTSVDFSVLSGVYNPDQSLDARGVGGGGDLDFAAVAYGNLIATARPSLTGLGNKSAQMILLSDIAVTEAAEATALAYTTTDTGAEAYDHLKALLVRDYAGETATTCARTGDTLDFGSLDVTIDGTTTGEAVVTGSGVTLHSASFTGNITTTGTVTLIGATVTGIITDSAGTTGLLELT